MTQPELDRLLDDNLKALMDTLGGSAVTNHVPIPKDSSFAPGEMLFLGWTGSIAPTVGFTAQPMAHPPISVTVQGAAQAGLTKRQEAAAILKKLLLSQYQMRSPSVNGIGVDWPLNDLQNFLFILIPEADFEAHGGDKSFRIEVSIHSKKDPTKTLNRKGPMPYDVAEFNANPALKLPVGGAVRWAVHDPTGEGNFAPNTLEQL